VRIAGADSANAQLTKTMKFTTTFPFVVSGRTMPAGAYTATPLEGDESVLRISNGSSSVLLMTESDAPRTAPRHDEVTFVKRDDTYVLKDIWDASTSSGVESIPVQAHHAAHHRGHVEDHY
jgi:hypothetical protein